MRSECESFTLNQHRGRAIRFLILVGFDFRGRITQKKNQSSRTLLPTINEKKTSERKKEKKKSVLVPSKVPTIASCVNSNPHQKKIEPHKPCCGRRNRRNLLFWKSTAAFSGVSPGMRASPSTFSVLTMMKMIAFITIKSSLVSLIEGLCAQI